jgi:hypothetical protein
MGACLTLETRFARPWPAPTAVCATRRPPSPALTPAETAQAAIFTEALLGAERARFEEIKAVAK